MRHHEQQITARPVVVDLDTHKKLANHVPLAICLGLDLEELRPGYARAKLTIMEDMRNMYGATHGAVLLAAADHLAGATAGMYGKYVGLQLTANFIRSPAVGTVVTVEGYLVHLGRSTAVVEVLAQSTEQGMLLRAMVTGINLGLREDEGDER